MAQIIPGPFGTKCFILSNVCTQEFEVWFLKPRLVPSSYEPIRHFIRNFFKMAALDFYFDIYGVFKGQTSSAYDLTDIGC